MSEEDPFHPEPSPGNIDQDPTANILARNQIIDQLLDPEHTLPNVDVYPVLGDIFFRKDLANQYPPGTLLPVEEAIKSGKDLSLHLGYEGEIVGDMLLSPRPEFGENVLYVVDTYVRSDLQGRGFGKALFLAALKSLPLGVEITHSRLTDDGKRMLAWLADKGIVVRRSGYRNGAPGEYMSRLNALH